VLRTVLRIGSLVAGALVTGMLGMLIGAWFGGNYAEGFRFAGVQAYEATGRVGFIIGIIVGIWMSEFFWRRNKDKEQ